MHSRSKGLVGSIFATRLFDLIPVTHPALSLRVDLVVEDPDHVRQVFDKKAMNALVESIRCYGLMCPIQVRAHPNQENRYLLIHGARRLRAAKQIGLLTVPAIECVEPGPLESLTEQLMHQPFTPEEVTSLLHRALGQGLSQAQIARALGRSPAWVSMSVARGHPSEKR